MSSQILQISAKYIKPLFLIISLVVLYRGHNLPGGGFIGGLLAASGYIFYMMTFDAKTTIKKMWIKPFQLMGLGILLAVASGFFGFFNADPFMTGQWVTVLGIKLGSPTIFDVGVYFTVIGVVLTVMVAILDKQE